MESSKQINVSRIPQAVWRTKSSSATSTTCRDDPIAAKGGRQKYDVSRLPARPAKSKGKQPDFDSVPTAVAVYRDWDNESEAIGHRWQTYVEPEDRCGRFEWSDNVTEVRRPQQKLGDGNGDHAANRRTRSDWAAAQKVETLAAKEDKRLRKQEVVDAYTGGPPKQAPSVSVKAGQRTSSYINRKANEREIARINSIILKKLHNVKSTMPKRR